MAPLNDDPIVMLSAVPENVTSPAFSGHLRGRQVTPRLGT
jgi:hypothetical protein